MTRKKTNKSQKIIVEETELQYQAIANNSKKELEKSRKALLDAKKVEQELIERGYIWIYKEKTSKLVRPDRVKLYFEDGWKKQEQIIN